MAHIGRFYMQASFLSLNLQLKTRDSTKATVHSSVSRVDRGSYRLSVKTSQVQLALDENPQYAPYLAGAKSHLHHGYACILAI